MGGVLDVRREFTYFGFQVIVGKFRYFLCRVIGSRNNWASRVSLLMDILGLM